jgi:streptogramin lyase
MSTGNSLPLNINQTLLWKTRNFSDDVYDFNPDDLLTNLMGILLGGTGTGQLSSVQIAAQLAQKYLLFSDLENTIGKLINSPRFSSELYNNSINPFTDQLTLSQWQDVYSKDSSYRERLLALMGALLKGGTVFGIQETSEAVSQVQVSVIENWTSASGIAATNGWSSGFGPKETIIVYNCPSNLFVTNSQRNATFQALSNITPVGTIITQASGNINNFVPINYPVTITGGVPITSVLSGNSNGAPILQPFALAFDNQQNLWIGNSNSSNILKVASGTTTAVTTISGYNYPNPLAFDNQQNLWFADNSGYIYKTLSGTTTPIRTSILASAPHALAFDNQQNLWFTDNPNILKVASGTNTIVTTISSSSFSSNSLAIDRNQNIWTTGNNTIFKVASGTTTPVVIFSGAPLGSPFALAFDNQQNLWISNYSTKNTILKVTSGTTTPVVIFSGSSNGAAIYFPQPLAFDNQQNLWIGNQGNSTILKANFNYNAFTPIGVSSNSEFFTLNRTVIANNINTPSYAINNPNTSVSTRYWLKNGQPQIAPVFAFTNSQEILIDVTTNVSTVLVTPITASGQTLNSYSTQLPLGSPSLKITSTVFGGQ